MSSNENLYNSKKSWYQLKPTLVDSTLPFDFNLIKVKNTGYIFLGTAIFVPFFTSILISYMFAHNLSALAIMTFINWIIVVIGAYFVISGIQDKIMRSGAIAFYYFYFIPKIFDLVVGLIISQFNLTDSVKTTSTLIKLIIAGIVTIIVLYKTSPLIFKKIKLTFKQDYKQILIVCAIAIFVIFLISLLFGYLQSLITTSKSNNQNDLNKGFDKWWNIIFSFIYTIIIAPINEELATRHGIFSLSGNKWIGYVASTIYFAGMHVTESGDWEHIIGYFGPSLLLGILFLVVNENVIYTIISHSGYNCIAAILKLLAPKFVD